MTKYGYVSGFYKDNVSKQDGVKGCLKLSVYGGLKTYDLGGLRID